MQNGKTLPRLASVLLVRDEDLYVRILRSDFQVLASLPMLLFLDIRGRQNVCWTLQSKFSALAMLRLREYANFFEENLI